MAESPGTERRTHKRLAALLAIALVLLVGAGAGIWVATGGPFTQEPRKIYVVLTSGPTATAAPTASPTPTAEPSPSLTTDPSASPSVSLSARPTATGHAVTPAPATPAPAKSELHPGTYNTPQLKCGTPFLMWMHIPNTGSVATPRATTARLTDWYGGHATETIVNPLPIVAAGHDYLVSWLITVDTGCGAAHTLIVEVDPEDLVPETDEGNNVAHFTYTLQDLPDLSVTWVALVPANPVCGVPFTVTAIVHNGGGVTSLSTNVKFKDVWNSTEVKAVYQSIPALAPGANYTVHYTFTINEHCGQTHAMWVFADTTDARPGGIIEEVSESNNWMSKSYTLSARL